MRALLVLPAAILAGGCVHLGAKPMTFGCGPLLADNVETYKGNPLIAQLQRDAGGDDPATSAASTSASAVEADAVDTETDQLIRALREPKQGQEEAAARVAPSTLMLSGGGSWGAFGAGFLKQLGKTDWRVVTGVSTGSLQGLFVAAGDYDRMVTEYRIGAQEDLALTNGLLSMLAKGSEYDLAPLRAKLFGYLLDGGGAEVPFVRMARPSAPHLFIGMVEAGTGDLKVVSITDMVRSVYVEGVTPDPGKVKDLADCVAGVALASSSIPVRLTPVQIDGRTYMDGGVRSSIFHAGVARRHALLSQTGPAPDIYVIRNGPTVVFDDKKEEGVRKVDVRPDLLRVGLRGYSTIVNQSELMSIAALRLIYPRGTIRVMTADGFNTGPDNPAPCGERPESVFEPAFMSCLIRWGSYKAAPTPKWIELGQVQGRR